MRPQPVTPRQWKNLGGVVLLIVVLYYIGKYDPGLFAHIKL